MSKNGQQTSEDVRFKDFDDAVEAAKPIRFRVAGRDYEVSGDPPVKGILLMMRQGIKIEEDPQAVVQLLEELVGAEQLEQMLDDGVGIVKLQAIAEWLAEQYVLTPGGDDAAGDGDGDRPTSASATSSRSGRPSRPTSAASTA